MDDNAPAPAAEPSSQQVQPVTAVEDNSPQPSPVAEPTTSVEAAPAGQAEQAPINEPAPEAPQTNTEHQPSRLDKRIDQLEHKSAGINDVLGNLKQMRDQASAPVPQMPQPRLSELVRGKEALDPAELDQLGQQVAQASKVDSDIKYQQLANRMVINEFINETEKDAVVIANQYDELKDGNPAKDMLEQKIVNRYQHQALVPNPLNPSQMVLNPKAPKLAEIAEEEVKAYRYAVEQGKAQTSATLATQADNSAVTPTGDSVPEKSFEEMSLPEQEAYLRSKGHDI